MDVGAKAAAPPAPPAATTTRRLCPVCKSVFSADTRFCPSDGSPLEDAENVLAGRFLLRDTIGSGNMGTVYRAVQLPMGRDVAVKLLHPDLSSNADMVARFEREALAASTVDHPNAITIYDSGRTDTGQAYIAMEFLDGESLAGILRKEQRLRPVRALELWAPAVKAMVVAHRKGVLHRDLKPDNIFVAKKVNEEGVTEEVIKVLDFGIAKILQGNRTALKTVAGVRIGTAMYMSPEQLEGREASKCSDVYALGLILFELITGRMPWGRSGEEGDTMLTMLRLVNPPLPLSVVCPSEKFSPELQALFDSALSIDTQQRPSDAGELLKRLAQVPEASFLAAAPSKTSDVSLMFSAAVMNAAVAIANVNNKPGADLSTAPKTDRALAGSEDAAEDGTATQAVAAAAPVSTNELPAIPTVVTGNKDPRAAVAAAVMAAPGASSPKKVDLAATAQGLRPISPVKRQNQQNAATMPMAMPAPQLSSALAKTEINEIAPTKQLPQAQLGQRSPSDPVTAQTSLPKGPASSATVRAEAWQAYRVPSIIALCIIAVGLLAIGYMLLQPASPPKPAKLDPAGPVPGSKSDDPTTALRPERLTTPTAAKPELASTNPGPPRNSDNTTASQSHSEGPSERRRTLLQVQFLRRRPTAMTITCGSTAQLPCNESCLVSPGEMCIARSPGFGVRRMTYEELRSKEKKGKVRMEVRLSAAL